MLIEESVTTWLQLWREGDPEALEQVTKLVYKDLRRMAAYYLAGESNAGTLEATALVHEAYLRVAAVREFEWKERNHFINVVAQMMRRILVDHARMRRSAKRDVALAGMLPEAAGVCPLDILAVDQALEKMSSIYPRCGRVVELRFFGDLNFREIAELLEISINTVERDWQFARAWLQNRISHS